MVRAMHCRQNGWRLWERESLSALVQALGASWLTLCRATLTVRMIRAVYDPHSSRSAVKHAGALASCAACEWLRNNIGQEVICERSWAEPGAKGSGGQVPRQHVHGIARSAKRDMRPELPQQHHHLWLRVGWRWALYASSAPLCPPPGDFSCSQP